jgi:hypothetical protein
VAVGTPPSLAGLARAPGAADLRVAARGSFYGVRGDASSSAAGGGWTPGMVAAAHPL